MLLALPMGENGSIPFIDQYIYLPIYYKFIGQYLFLVGLMITLQTSLFGGEVLTSLPESQGHPGIIQICRVWRNYFFFSFPTYRLINWFLKICSICQRRLLPTKMHLNGSLP